MARPSRSVLARFVALYATAYAAYGVSSPFFPAFLASRRLTPEEIGIALASGTAVRLIAAPLALRLGEMRHALRRVLVISVVLSAVATLALWPAYGFGWVFPLVLLQAATLAPKTGLADALAIARSHATEGRGFEYGWVRGAGSAAFVLGMLCAGQAIVLSGLEVIVLLQTALLLGAAVSGSLVPEMPAGPERVVRASHLGGFATVLRSSSFCALLLVAALVIGSHAMHDAFAVIRWTAAGIGPRTASVLWAESVVAEVVVFLVLGPSFLSRVSPAVAIAIACAAAVVRWIVLALSTRVLLLALVEPLHGLTFALFHLSAMRLVARLVPGMLRATALALYGTLGVGLATALLTLLSGRLYARLGAGGFLVMAALPALALPLTLRLRGRSEVQPNGCTTLASGP